jgi:hypothetical protein
MEITSGSELVSWITIGGDGLRRLVGEVDGVLREPITGLFVRMTIGGDGLRRLEGEADGVLREPITDLLVRSMGRGTECGGVGRPSWYW